MPQACIVEVDVLLDSGRYGGFRWPSVSIDKLFFDGREEALNATVIPAVCLAAHAAVNVARH